MDNNLFKIVLNVLDCYVVCLKSALSRAFPHVYLSIVTISEDRVAHWPALIPEPERGVSPGAFVKPQGAPQGERDPGALSMSEQIVGQRIVLLAILNGASMKRLLFC